MNTFENAYFNMSDSTYLYIMFVLTLFCIIYFINIYVDIINMNYKKIEENINLDKEIIASIDNNIQIINEEMNDIKITIIKMQGKEYKEINKNNFQDIDYTYSKIKNCIIDKSIITDSDSLYYKKILLKLYETIDTETIMRHTTFNIKDFEYSNHGYKWYPDLGLSIQGKSSEDTFFELIHMTNFLKINFYIEIILNTGEIVKFNFNF